MKRPPVLATAVLALAGIAFFAWILLRPGPPRSMSIPARGGEALKLLLAEATPHHGQGDPAWSGERIGGSGETIGAVGCTLCCVSMALEHFGIGAGDPSQLNASLIDGGGYTERGWILWSAVERVAADRVSVTVHGSPSHRQIDTDLKTGRLVLAKFHLPLDIPHWVLICGKQGDDYLVKDPAFRDAGLVALSTRTSSIHAIRTLAPRP